MAGRTLADPADGVVGSGTCDAAVPARGLRSVPGRTHARGHDHRPASPAGAMRIGRAEGEAGCCAAGADVTVTARSPAQETDTGRQEAVRGTHQRLLGAEGVLPWEAGTAAGDFARFGAAGVDVSGSAGVRTAYRMSGVTGARTWRAAARAHAGGAYGMHGEARGVPVNHAPEFAPHVRVALPTGIAAMCGAARKTMDVPEGEACR